MKNTLDNEDETIRQLKRVPFSVALTYYNEHILKNGSLSNTLVLEIIQLGWSWNEFAKEYNKREYTGKFYETINKDT